MRGKRYAVRQATKLLVKNGIDPEKIDINQMVNNPIDVVAIANELKIKVVPQPFESNISGVFFRKNNHLFLGVNETQNPKRQRFTIAHEIGHYILHSSEVLHYDESELHFRSENVSSMDEVEANHFAAELLMPEVLVNRCIEEAGIRSVPDLAIRFDVSEEAMRYRLINLGWL